MNLPAPSLAASRVRRDGAFTLVEIAIALAVMAFAILAVIGILQIGFRVQADTRNENNINLDGNYLLEAIRYGAEGTNDLADFVEELNGQPMPPDYTSHEVVGLLSIPGTNHAILRSITGPAVQRRADIPALRYDVTVTIAPVVSGDYLDTATQTALANNLYDLRLLYRWPVLPNGALMTNNLSRRVFRTLIAGQPVVVTNRAGEQRVFFHTQEFRRP